MSRRRNRKDKKQQRKTTKKSRYTKKRQYDRKKDYDYQYEYDDTDGDYDTEETSNYYYDYDYDENCDDLLLPTIKIAPEDYEHIFSRKRNQPSMPPIDSSMPTVLIAPSDYDHIYSRGQKVKTYYQSKQDEDLGMDLPSDAPTILIAPSDYEHIFNAAKDNADSYKQPYRQTKLNDKAARMYKSLPPFKIKSVKKWPKKIPKKKLAKRRYICQMKKNRINKILKEKISLNLQF
ncbi:hypothetical protein DERP_001139, partial [Dermatophagoides pteronyssinus]